MRSNVFRRCIGAAAIGLSMFAAQTACAAPPESEARVVARLYKDYGWQAFADQAELFGKPIEGQSRAVMEKYFSPALARLIADDVACAQRTHELCHLEADLLFDTQDPMVSDLTVTRTARGKVRVKYGGPGSDTTKVIDFTLVLVGGNWRIDDIVYAGDPPWALKEALSRPLTAQPQ